MRIWVFVAALIAFAQPAFAAHSHRHSHHGARTHHVHHASHHHYRFARAYRMRRAPIESGYAMPQTFARTDAIDRPFFSDPSFPNRSWNQTVYGYSGDQSWLSNESWPSAPAQQFATVAPAPRAPARDHGALDAMIARHAAANGLPVSLVHRVVIRESRYNPGARNGPNLGLMQIQHRTARGVGYTGSPAGLLNAETNLTYAVRYLAGAYRAAGGNSGRAVSLYASGYHGRGVQVARRARVPADEGGWQSGRSWGWQSAPVSMRTDAWRGVL